MVKDELLRAEKVLADAGVEDADSEARVLFECIYSRSFLTDLLCSRLNREMTEDERSKLESMLARRISGEPLQYIAGKWEFYGEEFYVGEGVLIPRQDTETLVDEVLKLGGALNAETVLDLCSGTGCIPIVLSKKLPQAHFYAAELSKDAFYWLEKNIAAHRADVTALMLDVTQKQSADGFVTRFGRADIITCNPPYLDERDMRELQKEVRREPAFALYGGSDGLEYYRAVADAWKDALAAGGKILFETGCSQAQSVIKILEGCGYRDASVTKDLAGKDRVVSASIG